MLATGDHTLKFKTENDEDSHKHCVYVKLTDSSARVIEEYLKNRDSISKKPTILFQKDKGEISFPIISNKSASANANADSIQYKKFLFALSGVKESNKDSSASFECISHTDKKLKTIGTIDQKLTVQANDEVFLATKERVNIVEEEAKKNSIRELAHPSQRNRPSNPTVIRRPINPPAPPVAKVATAPVSSENSISSSKPKPTTIERPINPIVQSKPLGNSIQSSSLTSPNKSKTSAFVSIPKQKPIESKLQWEQYTQEFSKLYPEYEELRAYFENLAQISLSQKAEVEMITDKNSAEYQEKSNEIIQNYLKLQRDQNHVAKQERYRYLEQKLGRMYQLIRQYEESMLTSGGLDSIENAI